MKRERVLTATVGSLLMVGIFAGCDGSPTEPQPIEPADIAALFASLAPDGEFDGTPIVTECIAGGTFTFSMDTSSTRDGDIMIRRTRWTRHYDDCGMQRGSTVITVSGELTWSGESHLEHEDAQWPHGVLYQESHQLGTLTIAYDGVEAHSCEYDLVTISEPAAGRYHIKGSQCGIAVDREIFLPVAG